MTIIYKYGWLLFAFLRLFYTIALQIEQVDQSKIVMANNSYAHFGLYKYGFFGRSAFRRAWAHLRPSSTSCTTAAWTARTRTRTRGVCPFPSLKHSSCTFSENKEQSADICYFVCDHFTAKKTMSEATQFPKTPCSYPFVSINAALFVDQKLADREALRINFPPSV